MGKLGAVVAVAVILPLAVPGWAQTKQGPEPPEQDETILLDDEPTATPRRHIDEIVVTARKREENLQDVPLSITALSGQELEDMGARTFSDYADDVASLNFSTNGEGQSRINLRGLQAPLGEAVVSYLLDDIPIQSAGLTPDNELFDVESIQILRGPQGTLYGAGAVGGAILVRTMAPELDARRYKALATFGYNAEHAASGTANVMFNLPVIVDKLGLRFVAFARQAQGYIDLREPDYSGPSQPNNYSSENLVKADANTRDVLGARMSLNYVPNDLVDIQLRLSTQRNDNKLSDVVSPAYADRWGEYTATEGSLGVTKGLLNYDNASLHVSWQLPFARFESISGYANNLTDVELTLGVGILPPSTFFDPTDYPSGFIQTADDNATAFEIFDVAQRLDFTFLTQEFRLVSDGEGRLQYTVGVFGKLIDRNSPFACVIDRGNFGGAFNTEVRRFVREHEQFAVFGELAYNFADKWGLVFGLRDYRESARKAAEITSSSDTAYYDRSDSWHQTSPKLGLNFKPTDNMLIYSVYGEGFRSGGFNFRTTSQPINGFPDSYESDLLKSYELGLNSAWFDNRLIFNASVFYAGWDSVQMDLRLENEFGESQTVVANLSDASTRGIEWEAEGILGQAWSLSLSGAYLDARLDEDAPNPETGGVIPKGLSLENVPHLSFSSGINHTLFLKSGLSLNTGVSLSYKGKMHGCILIPDQCRQGSSTLVDFRSSLASGEGGWELTLYGQNLTDDPTPFVSYNIYDTVYRGPPPTVGLRFAYRR